MSETFQINFGNAKPLILPPEGTYEMVISEMTLKQAKQEASREKGFNISLVFNLTDPEYSQFRVYHNLWCAYDNPWAAKLFFEALTGASQESEMDLSDPDKYVGETVGAALVHETYESNTGQTKTKLSVATPDAFYTV